MGPWEVLATWAQGWPDDGVSVVVTVADHDRVLRCAMGARVLARAHLGRRRALRRAGVARGPGDSEPTGHEAVRARVRRAAAGEVLMTSVCTGAPR